jgi:hypothetical protein
MHQHKPSKRFRRKSDVQTAFTSKPLKQTAPHVYEVVVACRDEDDQRTVFERMRAEGYRCRVLTL